MRAEYDFSKGKRGALIAPKGKTRITIYIDNTVLDEFRARAERAGTGYQTMMNEALKAFLGKRESPVTEAVLRQVIREELPRVSRLAVRSPGGAKQRRVG
ncbi:MAG: CopG family transcriptional regulator [Candidatus Methylomirabilota bacterium]|nr:BrnA antitoxin family protein [Candidatus Methylomirabilis sp.]NJD69627.1 BrnA antitoxin family protein [candidate division NC10 bacterium]PWB47184.1 MAG: CopG family transcriptional regulator [candidate division NC10 bacterium]